MCLHLEVVWFWFGSGKSNFCLLASHILVNYWQVCQLECHLGQQILIAL